MTMQSQVISKTDEAKSHMPLLALCGLAAIVAAFFFVMNPTFVAIHAKAQALVAQEVARENTAFCERRGFAAGGHEHAACVADLNALRARQDQRTAENAFELP
jgi:hypothetical protein